MILVDYAGHMTSSESEEELHAFADKLDMKKSWYQNSSCTLKHPHYDLMTSQMIDKAKEEGAKWVTPQELVRKSWWKE